MTAAVEIRRKKKKKVASKKRKYRMVPIDKVHPNTWNPNVMDGPFFKKLLTGLKSTLAEAKTIPPIVVRPKPNEERQYEIIDGWHRWKALKDLKQTRIGVFVLKVSDKNARILTTTLNYLRGSPDRAKYSKGINELIELGATTTELTNLLPESWDELDQLIDESDITIEAFQQLQNEYDADQEKNAEKNPDDDDSLWVDARFKVSVPQARVIEAELARIGGTLKGKNTRGRALEFMAVLSSQSPIPTDGDGK